MDEDQEVPVKYKHPVPVVSALQAKMLRLAGQAIPGIDVSEVGLLALDSLFRIQSYHGY